MRNIEYMNTKLTIYILSYNLPEQVAITLDSLLPFCSNNIKIIVGDNSDSLYSQQIKEVVNLRKEIFNNQITYLKHKVNLGANGNILRAFELADSEFLWIVSCKNRFMPNALTILEKLLDNSNATFLSFIENDLRGGKEFPKVQKQYNNFFDALYELEFGPITSINFTIYRVSRISKYIALGYYAVACLAPHLAIIVNALDDETESHYLEFHPIQIYERLPHTMEWDVRQLWVNLGLIYPRPQDEGKWQKVREEILRTHSDWVVSVFQHYKIPLTPGFIEKTIGQFGSNSSGLIHRLREIEANRKFHKKQQSNLSLANTEKMTAAKDTFEKPIETKIFLFSNDPGVGGVAEYNHSLVSGLAKSGYGVTYIQPLETSNSIDKQKKLGVQHIQWNEQDSQFTIRLFNEQQPPDLIICSNTNPFSNLVVKDIAIKLNIPYIVVEGLVEPHLAKQQPDLLTVLSHQYRHAKAVIAVSQDNLNLLHQLFGLAPNHGEVIHYGRPSQYFTPIDIDIRSRRRQEFNIPDDAVVCLTSARIERRKGYQYQMEAIKELIHTSIWNKLYFVWIGGGIFQPELETELKQTVADLSIPEKVILLGQRSDVSDWLNITDIFVLPSELEGMPLCIMEAMAKGLPVIASAVSGIPEELGETGKLIADPKIDSQATIRELVTTIKNLVNNLELRMSLSIASKQRAEKMFKEERMMEETLEIIKRALLPNRDYVSPGLKIIKPDQHFPNMIAANTNISGWPYLRREIPHNWYIDQRYPGIGFLSRDEANILYNIALQFKEKKALEIGCWMGWSACHLALAGVKLEVIDPLLTNENHYENVKNSLVSAGVFSEINLVPGYSPEKVDELAQKTGQKWSLIFIDGNHDAPGPLNDAIICEKFAEDDALVVFHDLASPDVAQGLDYFKQKGWNILVYQTMQIMGIAWRGNIQPLKHRPDPNVVWTLPAHLSDYQVSEWQPTKTIYPIIIIDGVFFQLYKTGIARVWISLLEQWANTEFANHILVLDRANTAPKINGIRYRTISPYDYNNTESDRQILQQVCDEEAAELFISSYYTTPITTPSVFMAYDMIPEVLGGNLNEPMWTEKHNGIKHASAFIAISENTAKDLSTFFPDIPLESITVAHCGVDSLFCPASEVQINAFKYKYGINKPYFLLSGLGGYKNAILFFKAFAQLSNKHNFDIVATGAGSQLPSEWRQYTVGCTFHGLQLSDEELRLAYAGAVALVYPSQYEGFGMPVIEAMACSSPVITTPNASLPEAGGDAVIYVKDYDIEGMVDALHEVQKSSCRNLLINAGLEQAKHFSWIKMAEIVKIALIKALFLDLNLKETNIIVFPDWLTDEEKLGLELMDVIKLITSHPNHKQITLLIDINGIAPEEADLFLQSIAMNLMMDEEIDITENLTISLLINLTDSLWQSLIPCINARFVLEHENKQIVANEQVRTIPLYSLENL